ncbi:hypothetical protein Hanom_Chr05g00469591 [Helianthus anomalus]
MIMRAKVHVSIHIKPISYNSPHIVGFWSGTKDVSSKVMVVRHILKLTAQRWDF